MLVPTPSSTSAARETHQQNTRRWLRLAFVITIIVNWCLIGLRLLLSPAFFSQPNDLGYILEPVLSLAVYAAVGLAFLLSLPSAGQSASHAHLHIGLSRSLCLVGSGGIPRRPPDLFSPLWPDRGAVECDADGVIDDHLWLSLAARCFATVGLLRTQ